MKPSPPTTIRHISSGWIGRISRTTVASQSGWLPPQQKAASFTIDLAMAKLEAVIASR
jgi:hypothetical protein